VCGVVRVGVLLSVFIHVCSRPPPPPTTSNTRDALRAPFASLSADEHVRDKLLQVRWV
jgi:hypothetical protein